MMKVNRVKTVVIAHYWEIIKQCIVQAISVYVVKNA